MRRDGSDGTASDAGIPLPPELDIDDDEADDEVVEEALPQRHEFRLGAALAGMRLDAVIAQVTGLSRAAAQRALGEGGVSVDGRVVQKTSQRVRVGDHIVVELAPPVPLWVAPEVIPLDIVFEDPHIVVVNKAAGMVVHPAPGHASGTLVNALLGHCQAWSGIGGVQRPGIVHRLDKDTSGLMVVAKHDEAHVALSAMFQAKSRGEAVGLERRYVAICVPGPRPGAGTWRTLYGRHPVNRKAFSSKVRKGKAAVTHFQTLEAWADAALVEFRLETGRTHQIRVHAADHGAGLLADAVYGPRLRLPRLEAAGRAVGRQALHAQTLTLPHPITGEVLALVAPPPAEFQAALALLR